MHRPSTLAAIGILTFAMAACGTEPEETTSSPASPQVIETQAAAKPFEKPPIVPQSVTSTASAAGLIQSTNANQRAKQVQKGRPDPFAGIFAPVVVKAPPTPAPPTVSPAPASPPAPPVAQTQPVVPPPPSPLPPVAAAPPIEPPRPEIASGIAVSGVVQIGEELQAIVQVPNEGISRYVRQGQLLSNGQVLVKQIELNQGAEPVIILEQNGIEVAKSVGEQPTNSEQSDSPAANTPDSPPDSDNASPPINNTPAIPGSIRRGFSPGQPTPTNVTDPSGSEPPAAPNNISPPAPTLVPAAPADDFDDAGEEPEDAEEDAEE